METEYKAPPLSLLKRAEENHENIVAVIEEKKALLEETMRELGYSINVLSVNLGNAVTRYEFETPPGIPVKRFYAHNMDLSYHMASRGPIRWEIPLLGRRAIAVEIPDSDFCPVRIGDVLANRRQENEAGKLQYIVGKNVFGDIVYGDLQNTLISGCSGAGKSMFLRSLVVDMLYKKSLSDIQFAMIDLKREAFVAFKDLPNLYGAHVSTEEEQALGMLSRLYSEVLRRKMLFDVCNVRDIEHYNCCQHIGTDGVNKLPYIVCMIDEIAELTLSDYRKEALNLIYKTASKSESCGIYFLLATQAAQDRAVMGNVANCMRSFVQFAEPSPQVKAGDIYDRRYWEDAEYDDEDFDSPLCYIESGASALVGNGDMLYNASRGAESMRVQGVCVTDEEIGAVINHMCNTYRGV